MAKSRNRWLETNYAKHLDDVRKYLRRIVGTKEVAEDLAHDAFLRVWTARNFNPDHETQGFLFTTARNLALSRKSMHRITKRDADADISEVVDNAASAEQQAMTAEEFESISAAINGLPEQRRQVLLLRAVFEYTFQEIADHLGVSKPTVYREFQRAIEHVHTVRMQAESEKEGHGGEATSINREADSGT